MKIAKGLDCTSIAFPNISTGVYKFPKEKAAEIVAKLFNSPKFAKDYDEMFEVTFVNFDEENYRFYREQFGGVAK